MRRPVPAALACVIYSAKTWSGVTIRTFVSFGLNPLEGLAMKNLVVEIHAKCPEAGDPAIRAARTRASSKRALRLWQQGA